MIYSIGGYNMEMYELINYYESLLTDINDLWRSL